MQSGRLLVNGSDFYCGNSSNSLCQLALRNQIPSQYVHPSTKQCNYSVDLSGYALKSEIIGKYSKSNLARDMSGNVLFTDEIVIGHYEWNYSATESKEETVTFTYSFPYPVKYYKISSINSGGTASRYSTLIIDGNVNGAELFFNGSSFAIYSSTIECDDTMSLTITLNTHYSGTRYDTEQERHGDLTVSYNQYF